jgi:hypothetical protein
LELIDKDVAMASPERDSHRFVLRNQFVGTRQQIVEVEDCGRTFPIAVSRQDIIQGPRKCLHEAGADRA